MAETIPGGAFLQADKKTWVNAKGEAIAAPRGNVYTRPEEPEALTEDQVTPGAGALRTRGMASSQDEFEKPEDLVEDEGLELDDKPKTRRSKKS